MAELDYILQLDGTSYNINAKYSLEANEAAHADTADTAAKVDHGLTIYKYYLDDTSGTFKEGTITFDGSENEEAYIVSRAGGAFSGPIAVPNCTGSGAATVISKMSETDKEKLVPNYHDIKEMLVQFKTCVLHSVATDGTLSNIDPGRVDFNSMPFFYGPLDVITRGTASTWLSSNNIRYGFYITNNYRMYFIHPTDPNNPNNNKISVSALDEVTEVKCASGGTAVSGDELREFLDCKTTYDNAVVNLGDLVEVVADIQDEDEEGSIANVLREVNKQVSDTSDQNTLAYKVNRTLTDSLANILNGSAPVGVANVAKKISNTATIWTQSTAVGAPGGSTNFTNASAEKQSRIFISSAEPSKSAALAGLCKNQILAAGDIWIKLPSSSS